MSDPIDNPEPDATREPTAEARDAQCYEGWCSVCGTTTRFVRQHRSLREGFRCPHCQSSLRYRGQASLILELLGQPPGTSLRDLADNGALDALSLFEPGVSGPFRKSLSVAGRYESSFFWDDVTPGEQRDGVTCQDLHALTFADNSFDFVITSDIMEHVRRPWDAFAEIHRVLKPGGYHVFSIPVQTPMPPASVMRVDTAGPEDVFLVEPHYHGDGAGGKSLVYIDYGWDLMGKLLSQGGQVSVHSPAVPHPEARRLLTFAHRKAPAAVSVAQPEAVRHCNICDSESFTEGPLGRRALTGELPTCAHCGSLERHRIIRAAWEHLPPELLSERRALQFSRDPSVDPDWFREHEISVYGTATSIDLQAIDRPDGSYDVIICNHILEHVERDRDAFREMLRITTEDGFIQMTVPAPINRETTEDWGYPREDFHGHYRHYGIDLVERFRDCAPGVALCYVRAKDPATRTEDFVFFWSRNPETIATLRGHLGASMTALP